MHLKQACLQHFLTRNSYPCEDTQGVLEWMSPPLQPARYWCILYGFVAMTKWGSEIWEFPERPTQRRAKKRVNNQFFMYFWRIFMIELKCGKSLRNRGKLRVLLRGANCQIVSVRYCLVDMFACSYFRRKDNDVTFQEKTTFLLACSSKELWPSGWKWNQLKKGCVQFFPFKCM